MTGNYTDKTRAVILAALMVFSVFAGTVAFTGSAAASSHVSQVEYAGGAVHYNDPGVGGWVIEVPFNSNLSNVSGIGTEDVTLLDGGDQVSSPHTIDSGDLRFRGSNNQTLVLVTDGEISSNDLEVELSGELNTEDGTTTESVAYASATKDVDTVTSFNAYKGSTIAFYNSSEISDYQIEGLGDDNNYFQTFASGTDSYVFYVNTENLALDDYQLNGTNNNMTVRNLGLSVSVDDTTVTTEGSIEGTVSARASSRPVTIEVLDSSGDVIDDSDGTKDVQLTGQGEYDFSFDVSALDVDAGNNFTVRVTDDGSGVEAESSTVQITEAADDDAGFSASTYTDHRGDVVEIGVTMTSTDFATVTMGTEDQGVVSNVTVEDQDGDGQATLYLDTHQLGGNRSTGNAAYTSPWSLPDDSDDAIQDSDLTTNVSNLIDAGDYDLEVSAGEVPAAASTDGANGVATLVLNERSTNSIQMWTGSSEELSNPSELSDITEGVGSYITQSSEIAVGDYAVHQIKASGLEGLLNAQDNEDVTSQFFTAVQNGPLELTIEEASPGANQDAGELYLTQNNVTVIADGDNDTYYVLVDTGDVGFNGPNRNGALPDDDDTALETNFTVEQDDNGYDFTPDSEYADDENSETIVTFDANQPDVTLDTPYNVSQASGQTISGTTNIAPGSELRLRIRSDDAVSPSFLKTASPIIQPDGTFNATFDFSNQNVGDTYDIVVADQLLDSNVNEDGTVVEAMTTTTEAPDTTTATPEPDTTTATPEPDTATPEPDTATPEPDTATPTSTPTSTPGFGVVVALTALIAAALLAIRRD